MDLLDLALIFSILSCGLLTGFIFTYAIIVMPGLSQLNDKEFLRAFQATDAVIQNRPPLFILTWLGSIVSLGSAVLISIISSGLSEAWFLVLIGVVYLVGVQGITVFVHLPLNNHIQTLEMDALNDQRLSEERSKFETKWNTFNNIRTAIGFSVSLLLLIFLATR